MFAATRLNLYELKIHKNTNQITNFWSINGEAMMT